MKLKSLAIGAIAAATIAGCVTVPTGPSVMVLPGDGRSFDQFRYDESDCRNYAYSQTGSAEQAQADSVARSALLGTIIGAAAGAALGGNSRSTGAGAAAGLALGTVGGAGAAQGSAYGIQRRYDNAYQQCMYSKGHRIAGQARAAYAAPPPVSYVPPPGSAPYYPAPGSASAPSYPPPAPGSAPYYPAPLPPR